MKGTPRDRQFVDEVFPSELAEIRARRETLGLDAGAATAPGPPSAQRGLIGLALSGGGIRSATFGLGVVEILHARGYLRLVDYVSTVSGGGYLGSFLSSVLNAGPEVAAPATGADPGQAELAAMRRGPGTGAGADPSPAPRLGRSPLDAPAGAEEPVALRHLRNSGNYLAPSRILDRFRLATLFLRGIIINMVIAVPYVLLAVIATEAVFLGVHFAGFEPESFFLAVLLATTGAFLALVLTYPIVSKVFVSRLAWRDRNRYERGLALALLGALGALALMPVVAAATTAIYTSPHDVREAAARWAAEGVLSPIAIGAILAGLFVMLAFLTAGHGSANVARLSGRLLLYGLGLLGPLVLFALYLGLLVVSADSPFLDATFGPELDAGRVSADFREAMDDRGIELTETARVEVRAPGAAWTIVDEPNRYDLRTFGPHLRLAWKDMWSATDDLPIVGAGLALLLFNIVFVNVNLTSIHGFYRDRLSRAYLIQVVDGAVQSNDGQKLSELNAPGSAAPYHLINVALNLQGVADADLRGRGTDFFIFSKHWCGGPRTGYCRTAVLEAADRHLDLGTAMAISGAAAAPNMGRTTVRQLVMILTLLNIRLGYWLPNPGALDRSTLGRRIARALGVGPRYLLNEAFSRIDARHSFVNVSDGGHLENSAIYELLRRRCRTIFAVDGEQDPGMRFNGLVHLIRYARIDMGIRIDIDVDPIRRAADGRSRSHWALGTIDYGGGETGRLIYIKLSITGDENPYIADYAAHHPSFPHESTADQFFDEDQFEAYRALGYHAARRLFSEGEDLEATIARMAGQSA